MAVTILVMVLALGADVTALVLEWNLSLARQWWGLVLFFGTVWLFPALVAYMGVRRLRQLARESKAGRTSQAIVDQTG